MRYAAFNEETLYGRCAKGLLDRGDFAKFDMTAFKNLHR